MDRAITDEEKIRRAIEISERRNQNYHRRETARVNVNNNKKDYKLFKKMLLQIVICLLIYLIFHLISTTNYAFSDEVIKNTNTILNYDINLEKKYKDCQQFIIKMFNNNDKNEAGITENVVTNNITNEIKNKVENSIITKELANNTIVEKEEVKEEKENEYTEQTAMEKDVEKALKVCKFQKPLIGTITSEFGEREATIDGMTTDHKGIDIAATSRDKH